MPELPEVETTIRSLRPHLQGAGVVDIGITQKGHSHFNLNEEELRQRIIGQTFISLERIGKWMLFDLGSSKAIAHLRMSGRYLTCESVIEHPHLRYWFHVENSKEGTSMIINYLDQRRFGTFHIVNNFEDYPTLPKLGPDALSPGFSSQYLQKRLTNTQKPIYSALLDQTVVAGLGNIYVNEALNSSNLHPLVPAAQVSRETLDTLVERVKHILNTALEFKGTTLIDNLYQDPEGNTGEFSKLLNVYGKKKSEDIVVLKIGGRSVFVRKEIHNSFMNN